MQGQAIVAGHTLRGTASLQRGGGAPQRPAQDVPSLLRGFAREQKSDVGYLDVAANSHGAEKGFLVHRALMRVRASRPRLVEVGPGGGAAVAYLAARLAGDSGEKRKVDLTLIEAPGVTSRSLAKAAEQFNLVGACRLQHGFAQDMGTLLTEPADVITASALLHEVYSYGGGYAGLHALMRTLPAVLNPGGFFAYRDVYAVGAPSLHDRVTHSYDCQSWLRFIRMYVPHYLRDGTHPYHHADDEVLARQNSRIVPIAELDPGICALITAPVGLLREIQRHYITLRDHVWRSGGLGFTPVLDGQLADDWIDFRVGHKRVHYSLTQTARLSSTQQSMLRAMSEPYADHLTIDGDIFDEITDVTLTAFLAAAEQGDVGCASVWSSWLAREGRETYAYLTLDELITAFAIHSVESECSESTILMPVQSGDILRKDRSYYNRFLGKQLANPLHDAKQMVLFQNIPLSDSGTLRKALKAIHGRCGKASHARMYAALSSAGEYGS